MTLRLDGELQPAAALAVAARVACDHIWSVIKTSIEKMNKDLIIEVSGTLEAPVSVSALEAVKEKVATSGYTLSYRVNPDRSALFTVGVSSAAVSLETVSSPRSEEVTAPSPDRRRPPPPPSVPPPTKEKTSTLPFRKRIFSDESVSDSSMVASVPKAPQATSRSRSLSELPLFDYDPDHETMFNLIVGNGPNKRYRHFDHEVATEKKLRMLRPMNQSAEAIARRKEILKIVKEAKDKLDPRLPRDGLPLYISQIVERGSVAEDLELWVCEENSAWTFFAIPYMEMSSYNTKASCLCGSHEYKLKATESPFGERMRRHVVGVRDTRQIYGLSERRVRPDHMEQFSTCFNLFTRLRYGSFDASNKNPDVKKPLFIPDLFMATLAAYAKPEQKFGRQMLLTVDDPKFRDAMRKMLNVVKRGRSVEKKQKAAPNRVSTKKNKKTSNSGSKSRSPSATREPKKSKIKPAAAEVQTPAATASVTAAPASEPSPSSDSVRSGGYVVTDSLDEFTDDHIPDN